MIYQDYINAICALLEYQVEDPTSATPTGVADFDNNWPRAVEYAELRMQRDLDFLASVVTDDTGVMTANTRKLTYPTDSGHWIVVSEIRPIISSMKQKPLEPVSRAFLDYVFPSDASVSANTPPVYWCPNDEVSCLVGPAPDQAYGFEVVGTIRFTPLSNDNPSNFLVTYLPDLYLAASMIWWAGYQRDAQLAQGWESQYMLLLQSADVEEARKKFADMYPRPSKPTGMTAQAA